jgi:hypothetical protein
MVGSITSYTQRTGRAAGCDLRVAVVTASPPAARTRSPGGSLPVRAAEHVFGMPVGRVLRISIYNERNGNIHGSTDPNPTSGSRQEGSRHA